MQRLRFLPLILLALLTIGLAWHMSMQAAENSNTATIDVMLGKPMPPLQLQGVLDDTPLNLAALEGTPYVLNVFASWCAACRLEHGVLKSLAAESGLPVYGMAWKDKPQDTRYWLERMGNIYTQVGSDIHGDAALELGLTGAPETYLVAADGRIAAIYRGALSEDVVQHYFLPAIEELEAVASAREGE